ncbi:O-antigen ligase family protein [Larkinella sp. VNQ87]|uniref:O-antigen ligase family protein n=1 Tax=Larkinella sp. VNQ87 TaxID=3400921 RepID=UPI003C01BDFB
MDSLIAFDKHIARLVMISFLLPNRVQVLLLIGICLYWIIRDNFFRASHHFKPYGGALLLGSMYLLYVIALPFTDPENRSGVLFDLEQKASLFVVPFALLLLQPQTRKIIANEIIYFVYACFISCLLGNLFYLFEYGLQITGPEAHIQYRLYFSKITGMHPTYMGIYLCFATAILLFSPVQRQKLKGWKLGAVLFPLFLFLMALMPKTPVIALVVMLGYYGWIHRAQKRRFVPVLVVLLLSVSVACISIPFSSQRIGEFSEVMKAKPNDNPMDNSVQMRQVIWSVDLDVLKENWLTGVGPGDLDEALGEQYAKYARMLNVPLVAYDTHNEYLNQWLSFGLLGIGLMLLILIIQFTNAFRRRDHLYALLLLAVTITFFTENVWSHQKGVVFYSFFSSLFFFAGMKLQANPVEAVPQTTNREAELVEEVS